MTKNLDAAFQAAQPWNLGNSRAPVPKLDVFHPIELEDRPVPERKWIVDGWIPREAVTLLGGAGGLGKSMLAMQLTTACATMRSWLGLETVACKAIGVFCEDSTEELHRRQSEINQHYDISFADLADLDWLPRLGKPNLLASFPDSGQIVNHATEFGAGLVVLDSLHDLFGGNENFRSQARQFIGLLREIAIEIDGEENLMEDDRHEHRD